MFKKNRRRRKLILRQSMLDPEFLDKSRARDEVLRHSMVARFSRGNMALKNGAYLTEDDLEKEREHLKSVAFSLEQ